MKPNPTRWQNGVFQAKATVFRVARLARDLSLHRWPIVSGIDGDRLLAESRSPLWDMEAPYAERVLQAGKIENLRVASRRLDGVEVPPHAIFSFWRQVGWPARARGYVRGRELRQGCLIPTVGGGLCQLSNALYDCALKAGLTIEERHAHTQVVPGSLAEIGRDVTVFWNYVDLRFRSGQGFVLRVDLTPTDLIVQVWARQ